MTIELSENVIDAIADAVVNKMQKPETRERGTKLDGLIADAAATLDHLRLLRDILNTGDCNECKNKDCQHKPIVGERVRYNCYDFKK